jgi:1-deoxy-D-xylulose-5-phosphate synthase
MDVMPERAFDVGIAEGHAVTFSAGMATEGLLPFCNIYSAFAQRAYDNIIHDVAIQRLNVVFCFDRAGIVGEDGATHHGAFDMVSLRPVPNLTICSPMNEHELRKMMYTAQQPDQGPVAIRYPRGRGELVDWRCPLETIPVGKGRMICEGSDVAVLSIGPVGNNVEKAVKILKEKNQNVSVCHYDMRYLKPLDTEIVENVAHKFSKIITVEDGVRDGGLGSAVMECLADKGITTTDEGKSIKVVRLGLPSDVFVEHGTMAELQHIVGIDAESICKAIVE